MGKNKKKVMHTRKEEQQGKRVLAIMGIVALILMLLMFVGYSYFLG